MAWPAEGEGEAAPERRPALRRRNVLTALLLGAFALGCYAAYFFFRWHEP